MKIRPIVSVVAVVLLVGLVPMSSQAAGAGVYAVKGTMQVIPRSSETPGFWTLDGTVTLTEGAAQVPKAGTLRAGGPLVVSVVRQQAGVIPRTEIAATTGVLTITWSSGSKSKAQVVHLMTHPRHTLAGVITTGLRQSGLVVLTLTHKANNKVQGQLTLVSSGTIDK